MPAVIQIEKSPKPQASCAMPAGPGMRIKTDTPVVKKAREGVMEFLLVSESFSLSVLSHTCLLCSTAEQPPPQATFQHFDRLRCCADQPSTGLPNL